MALALFALEAQQGDWNNEKIIILFDKKQRQVVRLSSPLPGHITYQTT